MDLVHEYLNSIQLTTGKPRNRRHGMSFLSFCTLAFQISLMPFVVYTAGLALCLSQNDELRPSS